jgi:hypothetical protein
MLFIIGLLNMFVCNIVMIAELRTDYEDIKAGIKDRHNTDTWVRIILIPFVCVLGAVLRIWGDSFWQNYFICLYLASVSYVWFDYILNYMRGLPWKYLGTASTTDNFLAEQNPYVVLAFRILLFLPALLLYIYA